MLSKHIFFKDIWLQDIYKFLTEKNSLPIYIMKELLYPFRIISRKNQKNINKLAANLNNYFIELKKLEKPTQTSVIIGNTCLVARILPSGEYNLVRLDLSCKNVSNRTLNKAYLNSGEKRFLISNQDYSANELKLANELLQQISSSVFQIHSENKSIEIEYDFFIFLSNSSYNLKTKKHLINLLLLEIIYHLEELNIETKLHKKLISYMQKNPEFYNLYYKLKSEYLHQK